jgi:hypothetical protein
MRKLIAIPLLVLYITAVSGMMIQLHFCGSKLLSWNVNTAKTSCCCKSPSNLADKNTTAAKHLETKEEGCCKDKTITLKIKQEQNRVNELQLQLGELQTFAMITYSVPQVFTLSQIDTHAAYQANAPPGLWQNIPLYKLHSRFTYYG